MKKNVVKFVGDADDVIEGLAIPFGGPAQGKDLHGEYFTPDTDFVLKAYDTRPLYFEHGQGELEFDIIGRQTKAEVRDDGVWAQAALDRSSRYWDKIKELVGSGALHFSSGALNYGVQTEKSGEIKRWHWAELTLTATPANPMALITQKNIVGTDNELSDATIDKIAEKAADVLETRAKLKAEDEERVSVLANAHLALALTGGE